MKYKNLLLIQPPNDAQRENLSRSNIYPPLGLLSIATYIKRHLGENINVKVIDLSVDTFIDISSLLDNVDILGISTNSFNYNNTLQITRKAKGKGVIVVLGGIHARSLKYNILKKQELVDYIIDGEGEISLLNLIQGEPLDNIPNLVYRNNGFISCNQTNNNDLSSLPIIDRSFIDMEKYISNFTLLNVHNFDYSRPTSVFTHKGCKWRDMSGGCIFCARKDTTLKMRPVDQIWHEIIELNHKYKSDYIWNIADDFLADINWTKEFISKKPKDLNIRFLIYARADNITEETIDLMNELNVHEVLVGFETGDQNMLIKARKGCNIKQNYSAAKLLGKSQFKLYPTFILGMPSENKNSMSNTIKFMHHIMNSCNVSRLVVSIFIPFPGSRAYQKWCQPIHYIRSMLQVTNLM